MLNDALRDVWTDDLLQRAYGMANVDLSIRRCLDDVQVDASNAHAGLFSSPVRQPPLVTRQTASTAYLSEVDRALCRALQPLQRSMATQRGGYA